jgi:hypothetical protein
MLLERDVDTVVVYGEQRIVEQRLLYAPLFRERFELATKIPFGDDRQRRHYAIYRRR